ncbi:melanocyte-stimulating hormone receptor-like [Oculina patagonica]
MDNSTTKEEYNKSIQYMLCTAHSSGKHYFFYSAIDFFLSVTAILGNTLILVALHKESSLHPPSKLLYRCLAITDLLVGLISDPSIALYNTSLATEYRFTDLCLYSAVIGSLSFTILSAVSLLTMSAISVDRLLALLLGLRYRHVVTLRRVRAFVIFFWIPSITFASMSFWKFAIPKTYNYTLESLCILVSTFCYSKIFFSLRHHQTQVHQHLGQPNGGGMFQNIARYRKTVSAALSVLVALVLCYLPYSVVTAIIIIHGSSPFLDFIWELTVTLVCLNSSLNPILYYWKIKEVRQEVKSAIRQFLCLSN